MDRKNVEPIQKVSAKMPYPSQSAQVAVAGCNDPHVASDGLGTSHALQLALLQQAQQLGLLFLRELSNLVEKNRTALCFFEATDAPGCDPIVPKLTP